MKPVVKQYPHALIYIKKLDPPNGKYTIAFEKAWFFEAEKVEEITKKVERNPLFKRWLTEEETTNLWKGMGARMASYPNNPDSVIDLKTGELK